MQQPRTLLAMVLSMLSIFIYYTWIAPPPMPPRPPQASSVQTSGNTSSAVSVAPPLKDKAIESGVPNSSDLPLVLKPSTTIGSSKNPIFENDQIKAEIDLQSGAIGQWTLKNYHQGHSDETPTIDLVDNQRTETALATTLGAAIDQDPTPYQLVSASSTEVVIKKVSQGLVVTKKFTQGALPYLIDLALSVENQSNASIKLNPEFWIVLKQKEDNRTGFFSFAKGPPSFISPASVTDGSFTTDANWAKLPAKKVVDGKTLWVGLNDRYFLSSLLARQEGSANRASYGRQSDHLYSSLTYGEVLLTQGESIQKKTTAFLGPKKRDLLALAGVELERSVDYGWLSWVATPILWLLIFFHKFIGNWGLSIIVLTFFIKLLLHPVNVKAMTSMREMQKIQPELAKLREKFANEKERLNMEMMNLFKRHNINPMGGCLPMVLQMPIYFALYKVLYNAIELYHAPFFAFYKDLSAPDPYFVAPVFLAIFMVLQQKLTPNPSMDPAQKQMMMFMPLMFSVFMIFLPAGLVIYIFVNTVMSVVQQYMITKNVTGASLIKKLVGQKT